MSVKACEREAELLDALSRFFVNRDLAAHVEQCEACREIQLVATALLDDRVEAVANAPVPSAGTMLWRIRMRQQQEAQTAARRSLLIGQAATLLVAIVLIAAFFGVQVAGGIREMAASIRISTPLLIILATWLVAAPIAGWVAVRQK